MIKRQLIVKTAQHYYDAAKGLNTDGKEYSQVEKNLFMGEVVNHTESALAYALRLLNKSQYYLNDEESWMAKEIKQNIKDFVGQFNIEL